MLFIYITEFLNYFLNINFTFFKCLINCGNLKYIYIYIWKYEEFRNLKLI